MESLSVDHRADGAARLVVGPPAAEPSARKQGPQAQAGSHAHSRDPSRLDRLYRLKLAGRDPERRRRRRRSLHELACWFALALLVAAALVSPVRAAPTPAAVAATAGR
ncbi:hypothetical protein [Lysobacter enzymogenes]|uniref:hypothetical protein n=1 Tax=Lysobacter enzymogenes TaxID=69 RepID=UPI00089A56AE|nr:hypothetical protein [Lysobacter enzymogenes]SDW52537.1 hypothetical protein SAMN05421681_102112 [Lysobacter enzymogenes]